MQAQRHSPLGLRRLQPLDLGAGFGQFHLLRVQPGRPGRAESTVNAQVLAASHTETTVERSTSYVGATSRRGACPESSATHISYF